MSIPHVSNSVADKLYLCVDSLEYNFPCFGRAQPMFKMAGVQEFTEALMQSLISCNEIVAKGEGRELTSLFHPEDSTEAAAEHDAFDADEGKETLREGPGGIEPFHAPLSFAAHAWKVLDAVDEVVNL